MSYLNKMCVDLAFVPVKHNDIMTVPADVEAVRPSAESSGFHDPVVLDKCSFNQFVYQSRSEEHTSELQSPR